MSFRFSKFLLYFIHQTRFKVAIQPALMEYPQRGFYRACFTSKSSYTTMKEILCWYLPHL